MKWRRIRVVEDAVRFLRTINMEASLEAEGWIVRGTSPANNGLHLYGMTSWALMDFACYKLALYSGRIRWRIESAAGAMQALTELGFRVQEWPDFWTVQGADPNDDPFEHVYESSEALMERARVEVKKAVKG